MAGWFPRMLLAGGALLTLTGSGCEECWDDDCGDCDWYDDVSPAAPTGLYSVTGDGRVYLYWLPVEAHDLAEYRVYVSRDADGPFEEIGETRRTHFVDEGATNGRTWFYAVSAVDECGQESPLSRNDVFDTPRPEGFELRLESASFGPYAEAAWDFSRFRRQHVDDPGTDIWFRGGSYPSFHVAPGGGIQDWGFGSIDDLDWAPTAGWSPANRVEAIPGHTYAVRTPDGYYAKFHILDVNSDRAVIDWAVQLDRGNRELSVEMPVSGSTPVAPREEPEAPADGADGARTGWRSGREGSTS
jgi:hypothetical protein